jgi:hypothetical protein
MEDSLTFKQLAAAVLADTKIPMTTLEIWAEARLRGLDRKLRSSGKTPTQTLSSDLHKATKDGTASEFIKVGARPRRYWLATRKSELEIAQRGIAEEVPPDPTTSHDPARPNRALLERELHPLLAWFADRHMDGVLVKTIQHERSKKKSFGEWVHPDLVGVLFPEKWLENAHATRLSSKLTSLCRLYSFELKTSLDLGNLRESFFQAVSNSSWAHESYLVASKINKEPDFREELERLCEAFRIGVIAIPEDDVEGSSEILIPAHRKSVVDWTTVDKLAEMNEDFAQFLKNVAGDLQTGIHPKEYDTVLDDPRRHVEERRAARSVQRTTA